MSGGFRSRSKSGDKSPAGKPQNSHKSTGTKGRGGRPQRQQRGSRGGQHRGRQAAAKGQRPGKRQENGLIQAALAAGVDAPRAVAFDVVRRVSEDDAFANLILPKALRKQKLKGRDAAFATEITYGTLRTLGVVDAVIAECSSRGLEDISPAVVDALRLGTYQVLYTRVEPHAAVDTTVRLVEASGEVKAKGFANGIMRTITRTPAKVWLDKLAPQGEIAGIAFKHAHPTWIAESFSRVLGLGELEAALAADSDRPSVHLVARPGEISAEELALMTGNEEGRYSPYAVYMESGDPGQLEPVRQGLAAALPIREQGMV